MRRHDEDDGSGAVKLKKALLQRVLDQTLVPTETLNDLAKVNGIQKPGKLDRRDKEFFAKECIEAIDYSSYLPQSVALTSTFMKDVLDPLTTVSVPTQLYRLTMRKLLRLTMIQLQKQADLMDIDTQHLDEIGIAINIMAFADHTTKLIPELTRTLLVKEIARNFGIRMRLLNRGESHPSSRVEFVVRSGDLVRTVTLSRDDILAECENQGIPVNRKEEKSVVATRLISWWILHPESVREPLTVKFARYLAEMSRSAS